MLTLCIHYILDPNKMDHFTAYVEAELEPIRRNGGSAVNYYLPTDFAGPTNEAYGLIDFASLGAYETYRSALAADADSKRNRDELARSGAVLVTERSFIRRV